MADDFGFEVPVEAVPLPSRGVCYPSDSPLYGKETVDIRSMTAREEDILTSRALIKKGTVITHLIKSCLLDKSVDVNSMISGDRNAIMTALRITGYGTEYKVEVDCPACSERSKQDEADITVQTERAKKQGASGENLITTRLRHSIVSIDGITDKTKISMFIRNMPARDSLMLRRFLDDNEPGIEMKSWMTCQHCLEHSEVRLPLGASFFWPDAGR